MVGQDAIQESKLEHVNPLIILGVDHRVTEKDMVVWPAEIEVKPWRRGLKVCAAQGSMTSGLASKMAGRLNFETQNCFKKFGRAIIRCYLRNSMHLFPGFAAARHCWVQFISGLMFLKMNENNPSVRKKIEDGRNILWWVWGSPSHGGSPARQGQNRILCYEGSDGCHRNLNSETLHRLCVWYW